ncbi:Radical SAM domain protein [Mesotoga infera]|jgi:wyosine [tRNA(Phe)-imidazoG37] synthetase (radical SAM superfamily)|uniref:Radical SAM domain protein n=1 Tax=Mesotoga infera TaxID=1236046 RepID=A0A7Z7LFH3_9BACT|nr:radical SAM protein [Mesotoga infera]SSC12400.1 Radical SAM domain protein [Mesotoga infera]
MTHVYGVVPSRRLGRSLGVSTIPFKTCNYSCIYCQLGRTTNMTNTRTSFYPPGEIINQVRDFVNEKGDESFDVVTVVGEGEPTLYRPLDQLAEAIRKLTFKPLVLITNGSLLFDEDLRDEISGFDIVMPTLDAYDQESFRCINRPLGKLEYEEVYEGLVDFSRKFDGELWLEVMLVKGYNDDEESLMLLKERISRVKTERVYINVPARPPAEDGVKIPDIATLKLARELLGATSIENMPVSNFLSRESDAESTVIEIIKRHPMSQEDIESLLRSRFGPGSAEVFFEKLSSRGDVERCEYVGKIFYRYRSIL